MKRNVLKSQRLRTRPNGSDWLKKAKEQDSVENVSRYSGKLLALSVSLEVSEDQLYGVRMIEFEIMNWLSSFKKYSISSSPSPPETTKCSNDVNS